MTQASGDSAAFIETKRSPRSVSDTVARFHEIAAARGLKVFAVIDQRAEALGVQLELRETTLVLFGSPVTGTPVMDAVPLVGVDLPLKILVWSAAGQTMVSYTRPTALADRYGLNPDQTRALAGIDAVTDALVAE